MGIRNRIARKLAGKAHELAIEHKDDLQKAILKAEEAADQRTGGKYHDKIQKAGEAAGSYVQKLPDPDAPRASEPLTAEEPPSSR
jgi:hypothetical protein